MGKGIWLFRQGEIPPVPGYAAILEAKLDLGAMRAI
jgi:hypothetical protein